ncbi:hypothetical protein BGX26_012459 [Mortierella sp. AD094]|nr:hypothetical protein BGX26_012459 [Mortierella sp. AD094]
MTVNEPKILGIASNGSVATAQSTSSQQDPQRLKEIQMVELQAPHISEPALDFDSRPTSSMDLFGDMEPHLKFNKTKKAALRSKLAFTFKSHHRALSETETETDTLGEDFF